MNLTGLKGFLEAQRMLSESITGPTINGFRSMAEFLLKYGRTWNYSNKIKPPKGPWRAQECYMNAFNLADYYSGRYVYVEGYASTVFPVEHAWCVDRKGNVIDPTWDALRDRFSDNDREYFGVAINTSWVRRMILLTETWCGALSVEELRYPILSAPKMKWYHPINRKKLWAIRHKWLKAKQTAKQNYERKR